ncbi:MAG: hypothetical protein ACAI25_01450 [Planctomycetota bacterium]
MKPCCQSEAKKHVKKHRDVAICDKCGRLVLGYGNEPEWKKTQEELAKNKVAFEADKAGALWIVSKDRAPPNAVDLEADDDDDDDD